jgi:hypothetical protein
MAIDLSRVASKALETALDDGAPRRRGHTMRTLAAGAALAVGARAAMSSKVRLFRHLPDLTELRDIPDRVRDRMADAGWLDDESDVEEPEAEYDEEEPEDEEELDDAELDDEDVDEEPEEPEDSEDEEFDDEDDEDEPEAEADEDFEDEDEDEEEDEDEDEGEPAPELEIESEDDEDLHPEDRPPRPPRSKAKSGR